MTRPPEPSARLRTSPDARGERTTSDVADHQALARSTSGDPEAFTRLVDRHAGSCLSAARQVLRDEKLAQEAVQEAYLDLWRCASRAETLPAPVASWLVMLTHRKAVDRVRSEQERLSSGVHLEPEARRTLLGEQTVALLHQVPDDQRRCLTLTYWGGYTLSETATLLDIPAATVAERCRLALQCLSLLVQQRGPDPRGEGPTGGRA